jgi:hypothetical protein
MNPSDKDRTAGAEPASSDRPLSADELKGVAAAGDSKTPPDATGKNPGPPATP